MQSFRLDTDTPGSVFYGGYKVWEYWGEILLQYKADYSIAY